MLPLVLARLEAGSLTRAFGGVHLQWVSLTGPVRFHNVLGGDKLTPWAGQKGQADGVSARTAYRVRAKSRSRAGLDFHELGGPCIDGFLIPLLGLIVFPYATLFYVLAYSPVSGGVGVGDGSWWSSAVFDIGHWIGGGVTGRQR